MIEIIPQLIDKNDIEFIKNNNNLIKILMNMKLLILIKIKFYGI